jgi:hypothetical protein
MYIYLHIQTAKLKKTSSQPVSARSNAFGVLDRKSRIARCCPLIAFPPNEFPVSGYGNIITQPGEICIQWGIDRPGSSWQCGQRTLSGHVHRQILLQDHRRVALDLVALPLLKCRHGKHRRPLHILIQVQLAVVPG